MEMGKDILTIAPDGVPCAYQIKGVGGGRLTLSKWRSDLEKQIHPLVHGKIVHPSIPDHSVHRSYIVINGDFDEEVQREIDDFNRSNRDCGQQDRVLRTIVKGELFTRFKDLQTDFWTTNLGDLKTYLELFLADGTGQLPKEKLCLLFEKAMCLYQGSPKPSREESIRSLSGCAVLCASSISAFTVSENHAVEFEAWTLFLSYCLAIITQRKLPLHEVEFAIKLAQEAMYSSLERLCDELMSRTNFSQGDLLQDRPVYEVRMTRLLGLMGVYGLWLMDRNRRGSNVDPQRLDFLRSFCDRHCDSLRLWGEAAIPDFLSMNFFRLTYDATNEPEGVYAELIRAICKKNQPDSEDTLPNPYYEAETVISWRLGLDKQAIRESFEGKSFYLESLLHLFVRTGYKQHVKLVFPDITRIAFRHFEPSSCWKFFLFRNLDDGTDVERYLPLPHRWSELVQQSSECRGNSLPKIIKKHPIEYLCLLMVMPYRVSADGIRWLASQNVISHERDD